MARERLHGNLSTVEYFTFGFGTMIGVGWVVADGRLAVARRPGRRDARLPARRAAAVSDRPHLRPAGAADPRRRRRDRVHRRRLPAVVSFAAGWTMVLSYAIVCPWEAVATGNLLARVFPALNSFAALRDRRHADLRAAPGCRPAADRAHRLHQLPRHRAERRLPERHDVRAAGRSSRSSPRSASRAATARTCSRCSRRPATAGVCLSIFLVLQIVPYFMTGFESVAKGSEEARAGFDPRSFPQGDLRCACSPGCSSTCSSSPSSPTSTRGSEIVAGHVRTEVAFERDVRLAAQSRS